MQSKRVSDSTVTLSQIMGPQQANGLGNVHGGEIMKIVDEAGALAAMRHAQNIVVTVAMDSMTFKKPIHVGDVLIATAQLTYVGRTSMEVWVEVTTEHPIDGTASHTNSAYVVYVALDGEGVPCEVPPLMLEGEDETQRWAEAKARQEFRKSQQVREEARRS